MAVSADVTHDVVSLLSSPERDYLLRNNGDQVTSSKLFLKVFPFLIVLESIRQT